MKDAEFTLNNKRYKLNNNNGNNHLHGGSTGFNKRLWTIDSIDEKKDEVIITMSYLSSHLEEKYPGNFVKFFVRGDEKENDSIKNTLKIYNKVGTAYGQITETAFIESDANKFILTATMYVNENNIINDDIYEYKSVGIPFFASFAREILSNLKAE